MRVTDILSELTRQLSPLERQSETARIYLAKRDTLRELDVNSFLLENEETSRELKEPVSYTHLDVYKRQLLSFMMAVLFFISSRVLRRISRSL